MQREEEEQAAAAGCCWYFMHPACSTLPAGMQTVCKHLVCISLVPWDKHVCALCSAHSQCTITARTLNATFIWGVFDSTCMKHVGLLRSLRQTRQLCCDWLTAARLRVTYDAFLFQGLQILVSCGYLSQRVCALISSFRLLMSYTETTTLWKHFNSAVSYCGRNKSRS